MTIRTPAREFTIVGTDEIDIGLGKISNESPVGQALVGRTVGDKVTVETPAGPHMFEILGIQ